MKTTDSLQDALQMACLAEGTMHTEELSKQYLDTVKKDTLIDSVHHKFKHDKSLGKGHVEQHHSNSGKLRICLDPTDLNPYIVRPVCNTRTLDEVIALLNDAAHFTVFDSTKGFFHVPLDGASKLLSNANPSWHIHIQCVGNGIVKCH